MNIDAGVAAAQAVDVQIEHLVALGLSAFERQGEMGVGAAGAADGKVAEFFAVEIEQDAAMQEVRGQGAGAVETAFFIDGKDRFEGTVFQLVILEYSQGGGKTDAVVRTERRAVGVEPFAVEKQGDGILVKIVLRGGVFLVDHIEMTLEDDAGGFFVAGGGFFVDDHIALFVADPLQAEILGHLEDIVAGGLFVAGAARDLADFVEIFPQRFGFEMRYDRHGTS